MKRERGRNVRILEEPAGPILGKTNSSFVRSLVRSQCCGLIYVKVLHINQFVSKLYHHYHCQKKHHIIFLKHKIKE